MFTLTGVAASAAIALGAFHIAKEGPREPGSSSSGVAAAAAGETSTEGATQETRRARQEKSDRPENAPTSRREVGGAVEAPAARYGEVRFSHQQGYSFTRDQIVPIHEAELRLQNTGRAAPSERAVVAGLDMRRAGGIKDRTPDCYLRSVVSLDPDVVEWETRSNARANRSSTFALRLAAGGYAIASVIDELRLDGHYEYVVRYAYHPTSPTFRPATATLRTGGMSIDMTAFDSDPWKEELDRRYAAMTAIADEAAARVAALDQGSGAGTVHAVVSRSYAGTISGTFSYQAATFSFDHATRDDLEATRNDWAFVYDDQSRSMPLLDVCTVTDDRSQVWDLGPTPLALVAPVAALAHPAEERVSPSRGVTYLIHTVDTETDRWDAIRVLHVEADHFMAFRWRPMDAGFTAAMGAMMRRVMRPMNGVVEVQMRNGAGGGNPQRAFLDATVTRVDDLSDEPLDLIAPISIDEDSRPWIRGGAIPDGKVWRLTRVEYRARTHGDSNGSGGLRIQIGEETIAAVDEQDEPTDAVWTGEIDVRPGDESRCYVEIRNSSQAEVRFVGQLLDE